MSLTKDEVVEALRPVQDPELRRSIVELGMVREVTVDGTSVGVQIALTIPGCPLKEEITTAVDSAVSLLEGVDDVLVEFTVRVCMAIRRLPQVRTQRLDIPRGGSCHSPRLTTLPGCY